jgi:hypothetical protein
MNPVVFVIAVGRETAGGTDLGRAQARPTVARFIASGGHAIARFVLDARVGNSRWPSTSALDQFVVHSKP